jgi:hypothetical protein
MWGAALAIVAALASTSVAEMKHDRRVLIVAAPTETDATFAVQRRDLDTWRAGAADRDVSVVEVIGDDVRGASDTAASLRKHFVLPARRFGAVLIGKDGHVVLRTRQPITADTLAATIDAMPMRKAGLR